jgi:hypothetical protein
MTYKMPMTDLAKVFISLFILREWLLVVPGFETPYEER